MTNKDEHISPHKSNSKPVDLPDRLSADDLKRHKRMLASYREAQQLQARANELAAAFKVWAEELHERYGLNGQAGEGVQEDGSIIRADTDTGDTRRNTDTHL